MIPTLVIIEDNKSLVDYIQDFLKENGEYNVVGFSSGVESLKYLKSNRPNLVVIDLGLEDIHGESVCREVRKLYIDLPIIILTGDKSRESIISCLNSGADDYITKPFDSQELLARIKARLRNSQENLNTNVLHASDLTLNTDTLEVFRNEEKIELTAKEFELLKYLISNKYRVSTRDNILYAVWGFSSEVETRVVDVHIGKLRKKLENGADSRYIDSARGYGYRIKE
ncbi:MAG: response regulator transcription factor [Candidatus Dojkabacteria bacterium]